MRVHVFESMTEPDLYGFTFDRSGNNLPPRGEWKYFKTIDMAVGETLLQTWRDFDDFLPPQH
jgi:hypothetical protein